MIKMHSNLGPGNSHMLLNPVSQDITAGHNFLFFWIQTVHQINGLKCNYKAPNVSSLIERKDRIKKNFLLVSSEAVREYLTLLH